MINGDGLKRLASGWSGLTEPRAHSCQPLYQRPSVRRKRARPWAVSDLTLDSVMCFIQPAMRSLQNQKLRIAPDFTETSKISAMRARRAFIEAVREGGGP
jgi:hypothetical protein